MASFLEIRVKPHTGYAANSQSAIFWQVDERPEANIMASSLLPDLWMMAFAERLLKLRKD